MSTRLRKMLGDEYLPQRGRWTLLLAAVVAATMAGTAAAETWAERLGYPADKKVIILQAHGMGVCYEANAAGVALIEEGLTLSTSALAPCPWFADFASWSHRRGNVDFGLSMTLNSEETSYRWQPVAPDGQVTSLVDADGYLWSMPMQTMVNCDVNDVERELRAQIERALKYGVRPTHLTAHMGTLFLRFDLIEKYLQISREYWIPAVVVELTPEHIERFQRMGFPLQPEMVELIQNYPLPKLDDLKFAPSGASYKEKLTLFLQVLSETPAGLTQLAMMPAIDSPALPRIIYDWQQRVWDVQLLQDPKVREALTSDDMILTTWAEVMRRYEGKGGPAIEDLAETAGETEP